MSYTNYLDRIEWQKRRLQIFERDNWKCQSVKCTSPNSKLEVHHLEYFSYDKMPWDYPSDMLISLCNICHSKEQRRPKAEQDLLTALKMKGFLMPDLLAFTTMIYTNQNFTESLLDNLRKLQNG